jgi:uncharacterized protein HemX
MKKHIQALTSSISKNRSAWLMGILNVIASIIIASGGVDIAQNKTEITQNRSEIFQSKETIATLHKRITNLETELKERDTKNEVQLAKLLIEINCLKVHRIELREDINSLSHRIDSIMRNNLQ